MTLTSKEYFLKNIKINDRIDYVNSENDYFTQICYITEIEENLGSVNINTSSITFFVDFENKQIHGIDKETNLSYKVTQIRGLNVSSFFLDENNLSDNNEIKHKQNIQNLIDEFKDVFNITDPQETEVIDKPSRYNGDHCQQIIEQWPIKKANGNSAGFSWCIGNILKYLYRIEEKGDPVQQIDKAIWYLNRIKSYYQNEGKK